MIRLAICVTDLAVGGAERCAVELATRLDGSRFAVEVYSLLTPPAESARSLVPRLEAAGIRLHILGARNMLGGPRLVWRLARLFRRQAPDIVQSFLIHANLASRLAGRMARVPRIVAGIRVAERRRRGYLWLDRMTAPLVDRHVCVSESVRDFSHAQGKLPLERLSVIPNGIDVNPYQSAAPISLAEVALARSRRAVTFVGRLDDQKGLRPALECANQWLDRLPSHDFVIVGDGPLMADLRLLARQRGIAERVHFLGWRGNVPAILRASDLLFLPSLWEGMPNVVLEAMAAGLPVVATDVEGVRELLGPAAGQQVVPIGDPHSAVDAIVAILSQPGKAAEIGSRNQLRAMSEFSLDAMVRAYEELYVELVEK